MRFLELILLFIVVVILVVISVLNAVSASRLTSLSGYDTNSTLKTAHSDLAWSSVAGWIGLFILIGTLSYYFSRDPKKIYSYSGVKVILVIAIVLIIIIGSLSAAAAVEMDKVTGSTKTALDSSGARSLADWSAVLGIVGAVLVIVALIISFYKSRTPTIEKVEMKEL